MDFLNKAKSKILEKVGMGDKPAPDPALEMQKEKISQLDVAVDVLKKNFHKYSSSALSLAQIAVLVSNDVTQFYVRSKSRAKSIEKFAKSQFDADVAATAVFRDQFHKDILVVFDKWHRKIHQITSNLSVAEELHLSLYKQENKVRSLKDKMSSGSGGAGATAKDLALQLQEAESECTFLKGRLDSMKAKLDETITELVEARFEIFDHILVRLMECQLEYFAASMKAMEPLGGNVVNFRKRFPRGFIPKVLLEDGEASPAAEVSVPSAETASVKPTAGSSATPDASKKPLKKSGSRKGSAAAEAAGGAEEEVEEVEEEVEEVEEVEEEVEEVEEEEEEPEEMKVAPPKQSKSPPPMENLLEIDGPATKPSGKAPVKAPASGSKSKSSAPEVENLLVMDPPSQKKAPAPAAKPDDMFSLFGSAPGAAAPAPKDDNLMGLFGSGDSKPKSKAPSTRTSADPGDVTELFGGGSKPTTSGKTLSKTPSGSAKPEAKKGDFMESLFGDSGAESKTASPAKSSASSAPKKAASSGGKKPSAASIPKAVPAGPSEVIEDTGIDQDKYTGRKETPAIISVTKGEVELKAENIAEVIEANQAEKLDAFKESVAKAEDLLAKKQSVRIALDPKLDEWEYKSGVRKNLRTLLTTLNTVLWEGHGIKIDIAALMTDKGVKKCYRDALLVVHPDKIEADPVKQVIAERVYSALQAQWSAENSR